MKTILFPITLLIVAILTCCTLNAETRFSLESNKTNKLSVNSFSKLSVSHPVQVTYIPTSSGKSEITIVSAKPHEGDIVIKNSGNSLNISLDLPSGNNLNSNDFDVKINITGSPLQDISTSLGAKVTVTSALSVASFSASTSTGGAISMAGLNVKGELDIETSSGGSFSLNGQSSASSLEVECTSGSQINIENTVTANKTEIEVSSGSSLNLNGINSPVVDIESSSAGKVTITDIKTSELEIEASTAANVTVSGTAKKAKGSAASTALINLKDLKCDGIKSHTSSYGKVKY